MGGVLRTSLWRASYSVLSHCMLVAKNALNTVMLWKTLNKFFFKKSVGEMANFTTAHKFRNVTSFYVRLVSYAR